MISYICFDFSFFPSFIVRVSFAEYLEYTGLFLMAVLYRHWQIFGIILGYYWTLVKFTIKRLVIV